MRATRNLAAIPLLFLGGLLAGPAWSLQSEASEQAPPRESVRPTLPSEWTDDLQWRAIGPANMGGRIVSIAVVESDPSTWWAATASGGLLKTTNNGITLEHQFDHESVVSIGDVQVSQSNPDIVWVGTGEANPRNSVSWGNGVYKSTDGGETWKHMGLEESFQIGRMAIHPTDPDTVYVGALGRLWGPNSQRGLFKTTDGGKNWERILDLGDETGVIDVQMDPSNPDNLLVASYERQRDGFDTNDPAKKLGEGSALYRTTDGGANFTQVTEGLPTVTLGRIGLDYYQKDPNVVFAVVESEKIAQEHENAPFMGIRGEDADVGCRITAVTEDTAADEAGLEVDDIVISMNGEQLASYDDFLERIRDHVAGDVVTLDVSRERSPMKIEVTLGKREPAENGQPRTPYSSGLGGQSENIQDRQGPNGHDFGGLYRSDDGGTTWKRINSVNPRPMYYSQVRVDPSDDQHLYVLGTSLYRSKDGGETFTADGGRGIHVDNHALWVDPNDGEHMILGCDGGIHVTYDRMDSWDHLNHVAIGQFYHVDIDQERNYRVYGGLQDNGSWGGPNLVRDNSGPINSDWFRVGGGDGFTCRIDANDPNLIYYTSQNGGMGRRHLVTGEFGSNRPRGERGTSYRFNWDTPFMLSSHNSRIFYAAGNYVWRSLDRGNGMKRISPEITTGDRGAATAFGESPIDSDVLYVGTDDGAVWMTRDGGTNWIDLRAIGVDAEAEPTPEPAPEGDPAEAEMVAELLEEVATELVSAPVVQDADNSTPADAVSGTWNARTVGDDEGEFSFDLVLGKKNAVTGSLTSEFGEGEVTEGVWNADKKELTFRFDMEQTSAEFSGTVDGNSMEGEISLGGGVFKIEFNAERGSESAASQESAARDEGAEVIELDTQDPDTAGPVERRRPGGSRGDRDEEEGPKGPSMSDLVAEPRFVTALWPSKFEAGRVYCTLDGHRSDDDEPYVLVSEDYGQSWASIRGNLPTSAGSTLDIVEDPFNRDLLWLGCEFSAWVSIDRGESWTRLKGDFPTVAVHDFAIHPTSGEVVLATHGRSIWIVDATPLRQFTEDTIDADAHLYAPNDVVRWRSLPSAGSSGNRRFVGQNPSQAAHIFFSLDKRARDISLRITDMAGETLREFEIEGDKGLHHVSWDLRRVRQATEAGQPRRRGRSGTVGAGTYRVVLEAGDESFSQDFEVILDPNYHDGQWLTFEEEFEAFEAELHGEEDDGGEQDRDTDF